MNSPHRGFSPWRPPIVVLLCLAGCLAALPAGAAIWYVDDNGPGDPGPGNPAVSDPAENGSAFHPFDAIQEGIDAAASGDAVLVADGTYTGPGNRDMDFQGKAIAVSSSSGPAGCIIDCQGSGSNPHYAFLFHSAEDAGSVLAGFTITGGDHDTYAAGVHCSSASPLILGNVFTGNTGFDFGGALGISSSSAIIAGNVIRGNTAEYGGGIFCAGSGQPLIVDNLITGNSAYGGSGPSGGGIYCFAGAAVLTPAIVNCTIVGNQGGAEGGGGIAGDLLAYVTLVNCILWDNEPDPIDIFLGSITYSDVQGGYTGEGNIDGDPLFVAGAGGDYCLSQVAAGQAANSPCVNSGYLPAAESCYSEAERTICLSQSTTRTDRVVDEGQGDMGYHAPGLGLVAGPGRGYDNPPAVRILPLGPDAAFLYEFDAYTAPHYGVNVTCGDVAGAATGIDEVITGAGPGDIYGPHVRGFNVIGGPLPGLSFFAYGTHKYGVNVACGDLDDDGFDEIVTGAGPGAVFGPHVRAFDYDGGPAVAPVPGVSFFAYGTHKWGVNVTAGDIDGDGYDEIVTGAGPGTVFGPHVRGWNVDGGAAAAIPAVSFLAYGTHKWGVNVACGDVDGDGMAEIVTAPGPAAVFGANIRGWNYDGSAVAPLPGFNFFAWPSSQARYGAKVFAGADLDGNGRDEVIVGAGPDPAAASLVKVYRYLGGQASEWFSLQAFPDGWMYGATVAAGRF